MSYECYGFTETSVADDLSFKTDIFFEKYSMGLSIESYFYAYYTNSMTSHKYSEVVTLMPDSEAIKLRDALIAMYPMESK